MKPLPHEYTVRIAGTATGDATLSAAGIADLPTAPPVEFDGPGDAWSPEQLLLAALTSCFLLTFRAIASASHVEFAALTVEAAGVVDRADARTRFTEIVLRPRVTLPAGADPARVGRLLEKAEKACLVSASLATPIRLEPDIAA